MLKVCYFLAILRAERSAIYNIWLVNFFELGRGLKVIRQISYACQLSLLVRLPPLLWKIPFTTQTVA